MSSSKSRSASSKVVGGIPEGSPDSGSNSTHSKASSDKSIRSIDSKSLKVTAAASTNSNHQDSSPASEKRAVTKGSELQEKLGQAKVDLKKAKNQLAMAEDASSKVAGGIPKGSPDSGSNSTHSKASSDKSTRLIDSKSLKVTTAAATNSNNRSNHQNSSPASEKRVVTKGSELQEQLGQAKVDLKKAKNQLAMAEDASSKVAGGIPKGSPDSGSNSTHSKASSDKSTRLIDSKSLKVTAAAAATNSNNRSNHQNSNTASEKRAVTKGSELQEQLGQAQVDLKKAKDQLAMAEDAKSRALEELRKMKKLAEEANSKLSEVLSKQKHAQEDSELEKCRVGGSKQASMTAAQKKEKAWQLEIEELQKQRSLDSAALFATKQDLERTTKELSVALEAKTFALNQAEEARKMADANARRIRDLSAEPTFLKESRESSDSRTAADKGKEGNGGREMKTTSENLKLELVSLRDSESQARRLLKESKERIAMLEEEIEITKESEGNVIESMISLKEQLEETKMSLQVSRLEISSLEEKVETLEASVRQGNNDLEISHHHLEKAKIELHDMGEIIDILKLELENSRNDLLHARAGESLAVSKMQALAEEVGSLRNELRLATEAEEKSKKALDDLAMVLHEVTEEGNRVKQELLSTQKELENLKPEEQHKSNTSNSEHNTRADLYEARKEIEHLVSVIERVRLDAEDSASSWNAKELGFLNCIKMSEEEVATMKEENDELVVLLREAEEEARMAEIGKRKLMDSVKQAEAEALAAREAFEVVNVENSQLRNALSKVEKELATVIHETEFLKESEAAARQKVDNLMKLLDAATVEVSNRSGTLPRKINNETLGAKVLHDSRNDEAPSPKISSFSSRPVSISDESGLGPASTSQHENSKAKELTVDSNDPDDISEIDDFEPQYESIDKISDLSPNRTDDGETLNLDDYDHVNCSQLEEMDGNKMPPATQKKKKALLRRFGDMLKKKGNHR